MCLTMKKHKWPSDFGLYKSYSSDRRRLVNGLITVVVVASSLFLIIYAAYFFTHNYKSEANSNSNSTEEVAVTEKLTSRNVEIEKQNLLHVPPQPFINAIRGITPSGFAPTTTRPTTNYPQLMNYRNPSHPKNIQDVINYLSENMKKNKFHNGSNLANKNNYIAKFQNQNRAPSVPQGSYYEDPFYAYKPQDPSDINLLATASFRFAPPILNTYLRNNFPKMHHHLSNIKNDSLSEENKKPLSVTLNIYPILDPPNGNKGGDYFNPFNRIQNYQYRLQNSEPYPRIKGAKPTKMVVQLNIYPNDINDELLGEKRSMRGNAKIWGK